MQYNLKNTLKFSMLSDVSSIWHHLYFNKSKNINSETNTVFSIISPSSILYLY